MQNDVKTSTDQPDINRLSDTQLVELRNIAGFPDGDEADIINLSVPPHYTAYPNPDLAKFIELHGSVYTEEADNYSRTPFLQNMKKSGGALYRAHSYHTKVPYSAIQDYIEHYTHENDIILDAFCGSGMSAIAANYANRHSIMIDLSTLATFITHVYSSKIDIDSTESVCNSLIKDLELEFGWMYQTIVDEKVCPVNYYIWSELFICPFCQSEVNYYHCAVDQEGNLKENFNCPNSNCQKILSKNTLIKKKIDNKITQKPVVVNYSNNKKSEFKPFEDSDLKLLEKIKNLELKIPLPKMLVPSGDKTNEPIKLGFDNFYDWFTPRNFYVVSKILDKINLIEDKEIRNFLLFNLTAILRTASRFEIYRPEKKCAARGSFNHLYVPSIGYESNIIKEFKTRTLKNIKMFKEHTLLLKGKTITSTQSVTDLSNIPDNSIDYIFIDPPFGSNIMYSEINIIREYWLKVYTNNKFEAIINRSQNKSNEEYKNLMLMAFEELYRVLKPDRWITLEFHNSKAEVWNTIQDSLQKAGFIIAKVLTLDKNQSTYNQNTAASAVKNDLIINAYKPKNKFKNKVLKKADIDFEKEFITDFLHHLPLEDDSERTSRMLYSKMLAYYVQHGLKVDMDASHFYKMLADNFVNINNYWFTQQQSGKYKV